jgi:hypothetical protein
MNQSDVRRGLSLWNDIKAARRGPRAVVKRQARKFLWRLAARMIGRAVPPSR